MASTAVSFLPLSFSLVTLYDIMKRDSLSLSFRLYSGLVGREFELFMEGLVGRRANRIGNRVTGAWAEIHCRKACEKAGSAR